VKKGPLAEAQVVQCLREHGWPHAERRVMGGRNDRGDVAGIPGVVIEVKNSPDYVRELAGWVDEAKAEGRNLAHGPNGHCVVVGTCSCEWRPAVVWHKRRGKGDPLDWYVTMTGRGFLALLAEYTREA